MSEENKDLTPQEAIKQIEATIEEKTKGLVKSEDIAQLKSDIEAVKELTEKMKTDNEGAEKFDDAELKTAITDLEAKMEALKEAPQENTKHKYLGSVIFDAFKSAQEKITNAIKGGSIANLDVKVAGTMTITGNYSGGTVGLSTMEEGLTRIVRRKPFLRQLVNSRGTTSKFVVYTEQANPDPGAAGMTAEGAEKTQQDFDIIERSCEVKKISAFIKVSKEMIADLPFMEGEINGELIELVELKLDEQILNGDGLGDNLVGILENATAFTPGPTFALLVPEANQADVLRIAIAQIQSNNFDANFIVLNALDAASIDLTKDANGQYTFGMAVTIDGVTRIKAVPVIINSLMPQGDYLVGDFSRDNLRIREDINIQVGFVNDDFTKNLVTILAEMRACNFVKVNHFNAFVKGDFATDIAAILKP